MQRIAHVCAAVCLCWPGAIKNWGLVGVGLVYTVRVEFQRLRQPSSHMTVKNWKKWGRLVWIFSACGSLDHTPLYIPVCSVGGLEGGDVLEDTVAHVEYVGVGIESL